MAIHQKKDGDNVIMDRFKEAMRRVGLNPPELIPDGTYHRFHVGGDRPGTKNGWYLLFCDMHLGFFGCWKRAIYKTWTDKEYQSLTPDEKALQEINLKFARAEHKREEAKIHAEARQRAQEIWQAAKPAQEDHPYLKRKGVKAYGIRESRGSLVIPLKTTQGIPHGLQFIKPAGEKRFLTGTQKEGCYFFFGGNIDLVLYLAEGYATAASIHEATGQPVAVCFDCGNLLSVAQALHSKFPDIQIVVCADNDQLTEGNPGIAKATEAARAVNGLLAIPTFQDISGKPSDFNDLAQLEGLAEVKRQIKNANPPEAVRTDQPGKETGPKWPDTISRAAMPGLLGEFINGVTERSEADPGAVLATFLCWFGIQCSAEPHFWVGDTKHTPRESVVIVGDTSKGRKGTSLAPVYAVFRLIDGPCNVSPGPLSSGEGIIYAVRDEGREWKVDKKTNVGKWVVTDPGVDDKRLIVVEEEFSAVLQVTMRPGNTLSSILRTLYDSGNSDPLTKSNKIKTTNAHVGVIAHITHFELKELLTANNQLNGFGNRFLWICSRRPKLVPFPEAMPEEIKDRMVQHLNKVIQKARRGKRYELSAEARTFWGNAYPDLTEAREGKAGAMVGRAEAHVLRLALIYCLFRGGDEITEEDLSAALAFWHYADQSTAFIFGGSAPSERKKQKILEYIGDEERTLSEVRDNVFSRHISSEDLDKILSELERDKILSKFKRDTAGRPAEVFKKNLSEKSALSATPP